MLHPRWYRLGLNLVSYKGLSRMTGYLTQTSWSRHLIPWYAKKFDIRTDEAEKDLKEYRSLNEFFIRRLKDGLRPVDPDPDSLASPVDGTVTGIGRIYASLSLMVKGQPYTVGELLGGASACGRFGDGFFIVLYLSPADYHRVHSPVGGEITARLHLPGRTYPVHGKSLAAGKVLDRNERLITVIRHRHGVLTVAKVGALNVSGIKYTDPGSGNPEKGEELAYFEFGSTVVLLMENGPFAFRGDLRTGSRVRAGETLGRWRSGR